jgi:hypothetical protein
MILVFGSQTLPGNFMLADETIGRDCVWLGAGAVILVDTSPSACLKGCVGRDASGLVVLGLRCRHQLHAQAAGFALKGGEVTLLPALLKCRGAAVNPKLPLGNQPIV